MALVKLKLRTGILRLKKRTRHLLPQFILGTVPPGTYSDPFWTISAVQMKPVLGSRSR